jgi:uncharacterized membrane protein
MSEHYFLLKTLHVLGSTVLFGTGLGTALQMWLAHRSGSVAAISVTARNVVIADLFFTTPAVILQPLTGLALAVTSGYDLLAPWLVCSYALYLLAGACWIPVVVIQLEMRNLAAGALAQGSALPARYHRLMRIWFALGWPAFIALIVVFWLMVARPGLWI